MLSHTDCRLYCRFMRSESDIGKIELEQIARSIAGVSSREASLRE